MKVELSRPYFSIFLLLAGVVILFWITEEAQGEYVTCVNLEAGDDPLQLDVRPGQLGADTLMVRVENCGYASQTIEITTTVPGLTVSPDIMTVNLGGGQAVGITITVAALPKTEHQSITGKVHSRVTQVLGFPNYDDEEDDLSFQVEVLQYHDLKMTFENPPFRIEEDEKFNLSFTVLNDGNGPEGDPFEIMVEGLPEGWDHVASQGPTMDLGNVTRMWIWIRPASTGTFDILLRPVREGEPLGPSNNITLIVKQKAPVQVVIETVTKPPVMGGMGLALVALIAIMFFVKRNAAYDDK